MITVTRLNGSEIVVNADLIETVHTSSETVITIVDGKKYVVQETKQEVVERVRQFRAAILRLADEPVTPSAALYVLPSGEGGLTKE